MKTTTRRREPDEIEIIRPGVGSRVTRIHPGRLPFNVLYADCPWQPNDKLPGKRGAAFNYETQGVDFLKDFPLPALANDAVMFFWRISSMQPEAFEVIKAWGFTVTSEIVWRKLTKGGLPWFGLGRTVRAAHETCLVCTRGKYRRVWTNKSVRSVFSARVPLYPAGHPKAGRYWHSSKPPEMYALVEEACPGARYYELFARAPRAGWTQEGDELLEVA